MQIRMSGLNNSLQNVNYVNQQVLESEVSDAPVEAEDHGKEYEKINGIEEHFSPKF